MDMRSTGFVFFSLTLHGLLLGLLVLTPVHTVSSDGEVGQNIEIKMDTSAEGSTTRGSSTDSNEGGKVSEPASSPAPAPVPAPMQTQEQAQESQSPPQPQASGQLQPKAKKMKPTASTPKVPSEAVKTLANQDTEATSSDAEAAETSAASNLSPETDELAPQEEKADEKTDRPDAEKVVLTPVKESPPDGVESASSSDEDEKVAQPISPPAKSEPSKAAQSSEKDKDIGSTGKDTHTQGNAAVVAAGDRTSTQPQPGAKEAATGSGGGASKDAAVSYLDLKQAQGNKPPEYPVQARLEKRQGQVELLYHVDRQGTVSDVQVAKSSGSIDLDNEAVRAIKKYRYIPGQEGWARHPVTFSLKGPVATLPSRARSAATKGVPTTATGNGQQAEAD